jgi:uncharacterized protein YjbI with pentapeptide repeats
MAGQFEVVLVDAPPVKVVEADAVILASQVEAVLLVLRSGRTAFGAGKEAIADLQLAGARVVGAVLTDTPTWRHEAFWPPPPVPLTYIADIQGAQRPASDETPLPAIAPEADLRGACLAGADLYGAALERANLSEANLLQTFMYKANLREADLRSADMRGAILFGADLSQANLSVADLRWASLLGATLREATLFGANLKGANLTGADLRGAFLAFANLRGADLIEADLREANLYRAKWDGKTRLPDGSLWSPGANLAGITWLEQPVFEWPGDSERHILLDA